jgi:Flp pilus assembly protein TadB
MKSQTKSKKSILINLLCVVLLFVAVYERVVYGGAGVLLSLAAGFSIVWLVLGFSRSKTCRNCVNSVKTQ